MAKEAARVLSPEKASRVAAEVENVQEAGADKSSREVASFIAQIAQIVDVAELKARVEALEIKQKSGKLTDKEAGLLNKLVKLYDQRMGAVRDEVSELVEKIRSGSLNKSQGANEAKNLLKRKGEYLKNGSQDDKKTLRDLEESLIQAIDLVPDSDEVDSKLAREIVDFRREKMTKLPAPSDVLIKASRVLEQHENKMIEGTRRGLSAKAREPDTIEKSIVGYNPEKKTKIVGGKEKIVEGDRRFFHMARRVTNPNNAAIFEQDIDLLVSGKYERRVGKLGGGELGKELAVYNDFRNMWRRVRNQEILEDVNAGRPARVSVTVGEGAAKAKLDFSGTRRQRLEDLMAVITGEDAAKDVEVNWISKVGKIGTIEAEKVWEKVKKWNMQYGQFEERVDKLDGRMTGRLMEISGSRGKASEGVREGEQIPPELRSVAVMRTVETLPDGTTRMVLTEEGKRQQQNQRVLQKAYQEAAADMGWGDKRDETAPRVSGDMARYMRRMLRRGMPGFDPNSPEMMAQMSMYDNLTPEAATARAEHVFQSIMRTQESSRDPKNQMQAYELYALLGSESIPESVRDKLAANLALYDVRVFQSSAEDVESWAGTASFLWKEAYEILESDSIPLFEDAGGKMVGVRFKDIQNSYELYTTSDKNSPQRRFWMDEVNGSTTSPDLEKRALNMRRFMAFEVGKQMGIEIEEQRDGSLLIITPLEKWQDRLGPDTDEASFFRLFGLSENGTIRLSNVEGVARTAFDAKYDPENDYYLKSSWYFENVLGFSNITLRSVEVEQGGSDGKLWKWIPNILHKIHGTGMFHYFHQKEMGLNPFLKKIEVIDSLWRSMFSWKIGEGKGVFTQKLAEEVRGISGGDETTEQSFWKWFKDSVMSSDHKKYGNGYMLPIGEIRDRSAENAANFGIDNFNWRNILKNRLKMTDSQLVGRNLNGSAGAQIFLENFSFDVLNYDSLEHATIKDFVKYSGVSNKYFVAVKNFIDYPMHKTFKGLWEVLSEYHGIRNNTFKKFAQIQGLFQRFSRFGSGYETFINSEGVEASQVWRVSVDPNNRENRFVREVKKYVVGADGVVKNIDGQVMYREGNIPWTDGIDPFDGRPQAWSPGARRGLPLKGWVVERQEMYDALREGIYTPEQFGYVMRRWRAKLWFDIDWDIDTNTFAEAFAKSIKKNPASIFKFLYTIPRGFFADILRLTFLDIQEFMKPFNKEVNKSLGTDLLPA